MKHLLIFFFLSLAAISFSQSVLDRQLVASVTFKNFTTTASPKGYKGMININDQTGAFNGNDVQVGDILIQSVDLSVFRIDTIYAAFLSRDSVFVTEITDINRIPTGRGQLERRTTNYGLSLISPANSSGISEQALSIIQTSNIIKIDSLLSVSGGGGNAFDSNRPILRVPQAGDNIGGSDVVDWLSWWYFTAPTISLAQSPSTTVIEIGATQQYTFTSTTTNTGGATLSNGHLFVVSGDTLDSYTSTTTGTATIDFTPLQTPVDTFDSQTYQIRATQQWSGSGESGTATSNTRTIRAVYPVLYGMVADTATAFADPYGELTKLVQTEGNKTVSFTGTGLIVYGFPQTWTDTNLSSIIDPNGFNVTASFTRVDYPTVTSTGLTNNYTDVPYVFYFLNTGTTTTSSSSYTFNR